MIGLGIACLLTLLVLFLLKPFADRLGLMDLPGGRKHHESKTPLVGGIGIFIGSLSLSLVSWDSFFVFLPFFTLAGSLLLVGILDDVVELSPRLRLGVHLLVGLLMIFWAGNRLTSFGDLFGTGMVVLGGMAIPITLFAVAAAINAINMTDGVDGLCGGLTLIFLLFMGYFAHDARLGHVFSLIGVLCCCIVGFLLLNFRFPWKQRASVFMGDAGSTVMGFLLAWLLIYLAEHRAFSPVVALWVIAYPLMDTASVMVHRKLRARSMFMPGRDHMHHMLLDAGLSVRQTVLILYLLASALAGIGMVGHFLHLHDGVLFVGFLLVLFCYIGLIQYASRIFRREEAHAQSNLMEVVSSNDKPSL